MFPYRNITLNDVSYPHRHLAQKLLSKYLGERTRTTRGNRYRVRLPTRILHANSVE